LSAFIATLDENNAYVIKLNYHVSKGKPHQSHPDGDGISVGPAKEQVV